MTHPKQHPPVRTAAQVRTEFEQAGVSITEWAKKHGFQRMTVVDVLRGSRKGLRGEAHRVAVALGLKNGVIVDVAKFKAPPAVQQIAEAVK
jgi:gp16 family phage-associated protein